MIVPSCINLHLYACFSHPPYGDPRFSVGGPSSGVSLSQPGVMLSHRHGSYGMMDVDRHMLHSQASLGGVTSERMKASSVKSTDSLDRRGDLPTLSIDEELDLDLDEEDGGGGQLKVSVV